MEQVAITIGTLLGILVLFLLFKPRNVIGDTSKTQLETVGRQKNAATIAGEWMKGIFRKNEVEAKTPEERGKQEKDAARRNWVVLIILFLVAICISYALPDDSSMFVTLGAVVLIPLHLMGLYLLLNGSEPSTVAKVMVTSYFIVATIGFLLPEPMYQTWKDTKTAVKTANRPNFFKELFSNSPASNESSSSTQQLEQTMLASPGDEFQKVNIPSGKRIDKISFSCTVPGTGAPNGCIVRILHKGDLICTKGMYKGVYCGYDIAVDGRKPLYDEQFELTKDASVAFPEDLFQVIYMVATTSEFGPVEVKTTTVVSD